MSSVTDITIDGLKGSDRRVELGKLNLLLGPVGAGKSSIMDGLRFLALGYVPAIGKTPAATSRLMRRTAMTVVANLSDGRRIARHLDRTSDGLTQSAECSWMPARSKPTELSNEIRSLFGAADGDAAENLDLRGLLNASGNERAKKISQFIDANGMSRDEMIARLSALTYLRLADIPADKYPDHHESLSVMAKSIVGLIPPAVYACAGECLENVAATLSTGLENVAEHVRTKKNSATADERTKLCARKEIEDRAASSSVRAKSLTELQAQKDELIAKRAKAQHDISLATASSALRYQTEAAIHSLETLFGNSKIALQLALDSLPQVQSLRERAALIVDPQEIDCPTMREMPEEAARFRAEADALTEPVLTLPDLISTTNERAEYEAAQSAYELAKLSPWREVEEIAKELSEDYYEDELAKRLFALAKQHGGDIESKLFKQQLTFAALKTASDLAESISVQRQTLIREHNENLAYVREQRALLFGKAKELESAVVTLNAQASAEYAGAVTARRATVLANNIERQRLIAEAERITATAHAAQTNYDKAAADLAAAQAKLAGLTAIPVDVDSARAIVAEADTMVANLAAAIEGAANADARAREMASLVNEIEKVMATRTALTAIEWAIQRVRELDVEVRWGGLRDRMTRFLIGAGRNEVPYLRMEKGSCEFGWSRADGYNVAVDTLSGGENVLFVTALAAAVVAMRKPTIRCLLVEAAELGNGAPFESLLNGIVAVADDLDLALVATNAKVTADESAWKIHSFASTLETVTV